ncbi:MAG TPA: pilus assembly protein PilV [Gallionellaceae bacterium]|nr:pilus assembly protein PilV [Gallionellaceae bacterium]
MNTHTPPVRALRSQKGNLSPADRQKGAMLLEALISILIFSFGILAIVGLQAAAIKNVGDAKYRTDASMLANQIIGQMWADNRTPANLAAQYNSPDGTKYLAWVNDVKASGLPIPSTTPPPAINIALIGPSTQQSSLVTVTIIWQAPNDAGPHQYIAVAQIL